MAPAAPAGCLVHWPSLSTVPPWVKSTWTWSRTWRRQTPTSFSENARRPYRDDRLDHTGIWSFPMVWRLAISTSRLSGSCSGTYWHKVAISVYVHHFLRTLVARLIELWMRTTKNLMHSGNYLNSFAALGEGKDGFIRCPVDALNWEERKYLILEEILTYRPDILCLQEVDHYYDTFQPVMASLGYHGTFLAKPWSPCLDVEQNNGPDGCALFFRRSRFSLHATAHLRLSAMMLPTNQVAIVQTLSCQATGQQLCIAVTHLKARSGWERLRSAQGADFLQKLQSITSQDGSHCKASPSSIPLIVCGDFNAEPTEDVYRRFSSSPLGLNSAYKLLSSDRQTEPAYTTWKIRPSGETCSTLDYIWYTDDTLSVECLLDIPTEEQVGPDRLPSYHYPSDHISLLCDIHFREEPHRLM